MIDMALVTPTVLLGTTALLAAAILTGMVRAAQARAVPRRSDRPWRRGG